MVKLGKRGWFPVHFPLWSRVAAAAALLASLSMATPSLAQVTTTYTYDAQGQLKTVVRPARTTAYSYDAAGNRIKFELTQPMSLAISAGSDATAGADGVAAVNHFPIANGDQVVVRPGETVVISPLANDSDPDGDALTITSVSASVGSAVISADGRQVSFTLPATVGSGTMLSLIYTILDAQGGTARSTISIVVGEQG